MKQSAESTQRLFGSVEVLGNTDVDRIVSAALSTLENVGIRFDDPQAVQALVDAGAHARGDTVRFSPTLVEECLQATASEVVLGARNPAASLTMGQRRFVTTNGFGTMNVLEHGVVTPRPATATDLAKLTRLADRLDEVGYCQHQTTPQDVSPEVLDVLQAFIVLTNTSKHAHLSTYSARQIDAVLELGAIAGGHGDNPVFSLGCCSVSPLRFPVEATQVLIRAAENGIPFVVVCGAVAGVMSPVTLAGTLVTQTAEHLGAIVLTQSIRPGLPLLLGSFASPMDPRSGMQRLAAAELSLLNGATGQICQRLGLPFGYGTGGVSDACTIGIQAGIEKAFTTLSCALAGVEVIHDAVSGILDSGKLVSYEQMILDAELCRIVERYLRGIEVTDESLALSAIAEIGVGGNYLTSPHTARHFRSELLISDMWASAPGDEPDAVMTRANQRVRELLNQPASGPSLSGDQITEMVAVCVRAGVAEGFVRALVLQD